MNAINPAVRIEILKLPIARVMGAWALYGDSRPLLGSVSNQKNTIADWLAEAVERNTLTLDAIRNAPPAAPPAPSIPQADPAVAAVAGRAAADALDALQAVQDLRDGLKSDLTNLNTRLAIEREDRTADLDQIKASLEKITKATKVKVDDRKVEEAVARVVADAFAPFKAAVEAAGAQAPNSARAGSATDCIRITVTALRCRWLSTGISPACSRAWPPSSPR